MRDSSGRPPSTPCPRGASSAGCSIAPLGWRPPSSSAASQIPDTSRRGAGADFFPAYAGLIGGMLFHFSGFACSPAAFGGAVCAPRTGESVNPASRAITETTKHLDISEILPAASIPNFQICLRLRRAKPGTRLDCARAAGTHLIRASEILIHRASGAKARVFRQSNVAAEQLAEKVNSEPLLVAQALLPVLVLLHLSFMHSQEWLCYSTFSASCEVATHKDHL